MITEYLVELLDGLRVPARRRQRILDEVEDHLLTATAELHAAGLDAQHAEQDLGIRRPPS